VVFEVLEGVHGLQDTASPEEMRDYTIQASKRMSVYVEMEDTTTIPAYGLGQDNDAECCRWNQL